MLRKVRRATSPAVTMPDSAPKAARRPPRRLRRHQPPRAGGCRWRGSPQRRRSRAPRRAPARPAARGAGHAVEHEGHLDGHGRDKGVRTPLRQRRGSRLTSRRTTRRDAPAREADRRASLSRRRATAIAPRRSSGPIPARRWRAISPPSGSISRAPRRPRRLPRRSRRRAVRPSRPDRAGRRETRSPRRTFPTNRRGWPAA